MKKGIILSAFIFISFLSVAQVQRTVTPSNPSDTIAKNSNIVANENMNRKKMMAALDLTKEQKIKLKAIREDGKAKREAVENNDKLSDAERKMQLRSLQKEQLQNTMKILNEEQREKMKALQKEKRKNAELN